LVVWYWQVICLGVSTCHNEAKSIESAKFSVAVKVGRNLRIFEQKTCSEQRPTGRGLVHSFAGPLRCLVRVRQVRAFSFSRIERTMKKLSFILIASIVLLNQTSHAQRSFVRNNAGMTANYIQAEPEGPPDTSREDNLRELQERGPAPKHPWRIISGHLECIAGPGYNDYYYSWNAKLWEQDGSKDIFSRGWYEFEGHVIKTIPDGMLVKEDFDNDTEHQTIIITNYPLRLADGDYVEGVAKDSGVYIYRPENQESTSLRILDFGLIASAPAPSAEQIKAAIKKKSDLAAKALKSNEEGASKGDSYDEYRMGQRYRDGDGVPKDLAKAREWFKKASDQGERNATEELSELLP
jgi:hypothetical protein